LRSRFPSRIKLLYFGWPPPEDEAAADEACEADADDPDADEPREDPLEKSPPREPPAPDERAGGGVTLRAGGADVREEVEATVTRAVVTGVPFLIAPEEFFSAVGSEALCAAAVADFALTKRCSCGS